jgi:predicted DsbA family dithiol-disulfide isomerase
MVQVDIWSDVVCPWCVIGQARFEKALANYDGEVTVRLHPFRLDPDAPIPGEPAAERYARKFGDEAQTMLARVVAAGEEEGLTFRFDRALTGNTFDAHRAIGYAARDGRDRALERALFAAYFTDGLDITDRGVLADLAASVGEDRAAAYAYLESDAGVAELTHELDEAGALGITAVPTFVFNQQFAVPGAVDVATFAKIFEQMRAMPETSA